MDMLKFAAMNRDRCQAPGGFNHAISDWSLSDWFTATMGELGEAANVAKKLNRARDGIAGNEESVVDLRAALADEIADTFIYLDLLAQSQGFVLAEIVMAKWDKTSRKIGYRAPQLPLFAGIGDAVAQDDAFRDAVVHGTGATLGGEHVPIDRMHEHSNVERHLLDRQGDEFFCPRCTKRWGADEPAPGCRE